MQPLIRSALGGEVSGYDPPPVPGDVRLFMDLRGRLTSLRAIPPWAEFSSVQAPAPDWRALFEAAGLDIAKFTPTAPTIQPQVFADSRMAWKGTLPHLGDEPVRVEAAAFRGKPVYFEWVLPSDPYWSEQTKESGEQFWRSFRPLQFTFLGVMALVAGGTVLLAVRNLRLGRGDRKGASRLGLLVFGLQMAYCVLTEHHVADLLGEWSLIVIDFCGAVALALMAGVLYLALEPYVRRLWPETIVSWTRLLSGQLRDPLVGRDVLAGMAIASAVMILQVPITWCTLHFDLWGPYPGSTPYNFLRGGRYAAGELLGGALFMLSYALIVMMFLLILRIVLRRPWIAGTAFCLGWCGVGYAQYAMWLPSTPAVLVMLIGVLLFGIAMLFLLTRFGLVATIAALVAGADQFPATTDMSAPYFGISLIPAAAVLALAIYGFKLSLAGQPLFRGDLLGVDAAPRR
jgi:serine/threonine-protein kinase